MGVSPEFGRNPRWRHDHAVGRVAWSWRAEPVWVMAPRVPTMMQARRVRVSPVSQEPGRIAPMAARQGRGPFVLELFISMEVDLTMDLLLVDTSNLVMDEKVEKWALKIIWKRKLYM